MSACTTLMAALMLPMSGDVLTSIDPPLALMMDCLRLTSESIAPMRSDSMDSADCSIPASVMAISSPSPSIEPLSESAEIPAFGARSSISLSTAL